MPTTSILAFTILVGLGIILIYGGRKFLANDKPTLLLLSRPRLSCVGNAIGITSDLWLTYRERAKAYSHTVCSRILSTSVFVFIRSLIGYIETRFINWLLAILATGPSPKHIGFVTDGNRRYARRLGMTVKHGHIAGSNNLCQVLGLCLRLHIQCVTLYAFAIENFNRSKEEVDGIMEVLTELFIDLAQPGSIADRYGVRVNVLGRKELLPPSMQEAAQFAENMTRNNNITILNFCVPYSSHDEITTAVESVIREAIKSGDLDGSTITEDSINSHLSTSLVDCPPLDILVRTSGVNRLSGFLLWQCCEHTQIHMVNACWPEFGLAHLVPIILSYQRKVWAKEQR